MEIIRGSLEDISRPASSELTGSRVSSVSLPHNERISPSTQLSLVVLTNDAKDPCSSDFFVNCAVKQSDNDDGEEDLKLQNAVEEMKRLDKILYAKTQQEQEARRKRKELRDKLWIELLQNTIQGRSECAHEASNTRSFLALEAPTAKGQEEELNFEPVFETQAPESDDQDCPIVKQRRNNSSDTKESLETDLVEEGIFRESHYETFKNKKHKDFVKRNIELISNERSEDILTQAEKERLDELLREIDQEEEECARAADAEDDMWALSVGTGHGYTPEPHDLKHLTDIDSRIRLLLPVEEFASLQGSFSNLGELQVLLVACGQALARSLGPRGTARAPTTLQKHSCAGVMERKREKGTERSDVFLTAAAIRGCSSETGWKTDGDLLPGEKVLKDIKERRGQERRLQEIQQQLEILSQSQDVTEEGPALTEEQLLGLLEDCELTETWTRDITISNLTPR